VIGDGPKVVSRATFDEPLTAYKEASKALRSMLPPEVYGSKHFVMHFQMTSDSKEGGGRLMLTWPHGNIDVGSMFAVRVSPTTADELRREQPLF